MRFLLLIVLLTPSLRAETPGTEFRPYNHAGATARLRASLHQKPVATEPSSPSRFARQKQRTSTSTYFVPPKGFANCAGGSCRR